MAGYEIASLVKCRLCGLVFDSRTPSIEELEACYRDYTYKSLKPCSEATVRSFSRLLVAFGKYRATGRLFDIGCGQGDFLFEAKKRGWDVVGSEYSQAAVDLCAGRGLAVIQEPLTAPHLKACHFDVVTSFEVIEHSQTPNQLFENARVLLRPGGLFYLTTPNFNAILRLFEKADFRMISHPEHLCFYTRRPMEYLARKSGFTPLKITTTGIDLARMSNALARLVRTKSKMPHATRTQTDVVRNQINSNPVLLTAKNIINSGLGWSGTGDTLKAWLVKDDA